MHTYEEMKTSGSNRKRKERNLHGNSSDLGVQDATNDGCIIEHNVIKKNRSSSGVENKGTESCAILTSALFGGLGLSEDTLRGIQEMEFSQMTEIQARAIPPLLEGKDLVGCARTGSGKTLAFLIPALERLLRFKFEAKNGCGCMILSPTRELALQTYEVLRQLLTHHQTLTYAIVIGGADRSLEAATLVKGVNIVVATPGRLLDHLENTHKFFYNNLKCLIIDEADRILQAGFEKTLRQIINILPKKRQTMLFSATTEKKTKDLIRLAVNSDPVYVGVHDSSDEATVQGLEQGYVVCPSEDRFRLLFTFLKKCRKKNKKVMVFFSSRDSVKFHDQLLNTIGLSVWSIHGKKKQSQRTSTFIEFSKVESGILLCTDVAARGLDIPRVDWILQYDPPDDPKDYIHRVGRTARGEGGTGNALLVLRPEELGFENYLLKVRVPVKELTFTWSTDPQLQTELEKAVDSNWDLLQLAKAAFLSYLKAYAAHHLKDVYDVYTMQFDKVAKSFGLTQLPKVDIFNYLNIDPVKKKRKRSLK